MASTTDKSRALFERSRRVLIEGGSSPSRGPATHGAYPLFMERAEGCRIWDVDGNSYIDWMMAYGALPLGHSHPAVAAAVREAAATGNHFATATEIEVEVAELIQELVPGVERVRFASTGTEATMAALRLARGYSGRPKFVKFEGHYHGWHDDFLVGAHPQPPASLGHPRDPVKIADSSGLNRRALDDTVLVPWNDLDALERALETWRGQIAAVITEGVMANMGVIPPAPGYLTAMRQLTRDQDVLVILDETVTGFRIAPGGCQEHYAVHADLVTFGKGLGAGLPVAAFGGRAEVMEALKWGGVLHYGTQNASRVGLYAARANLQELSRGDGQAFQHLWTIGESLCDGLRELFADTDTGAVVQNLGPMFQILFTEQEAIQNYRDYCAHVDRARYQKLALELFHHGVYMSPSPSLHSVASLAHTEDEVVSTLKAVQQTITHDRP